MRPETNHRTGRYREHRQQLTRFSKSISLSPKYAFFAELILLWLDCAPEQEDKIWQMILYYISNARLPRNVKKEDFDEREDGEDTPLDIRVKGEIREGLMNFLRSEDE
jgi:hypothetical protein